MNIRIAGLIGVGAIAALSACTLEQGRDALERLGSGMLLTAQTAPGGAVEVHRVKLDNTNKLNVSDAGLLHSAPADTVISAKLQPDRWATNALVASYKRADGLGERPNTELRVDIYDTRTRARSGALLATEIYEDLYNQADLKLSRLDFYWFSMSACWVSTDSFILDINHHTDAFSNAGEGPNAYAVLKYKIGDVKPELVSVFGQLEPPTNGWGEGYTCTTNARNDANDIVDASVAIDGAPLMSGGVQYTSDGIYDAMIWAR